MKNQLLLLFSLLCGISLYAQVGIGTTTPNSTLDIRGSLSLNYRSVTAGTTLGSTDQALVFTGTAAATVTLPSAATIAGRVYQVKNASTTAPTPVLTIATTASQTIDGLASWTLDEANETAWFVSDGTNWIVSAQGVPNNSGSAWLTGGNSLPSVKPIGTITNYDFPFITNNTERMRLSATGNLGLGSAAFDGTNPEKLLVDAGATSSFNVISGKGTINSYLQLNIQNRSSGAGASSDVVATADNGNESVNYVDMGINSSQYNVAGFNITGINDAYLYSAGNDFAIGNASSGKVLKFFTGGTVASNERMRIDGSGNMGIGTTAPAYKLHVSAASNPLGLFGVQTGAATDSIVTITAGVVRKLHPSALVTSSSNAWALIGNAGTSPGTNFIGTIDAQALLFKINNTQAAKFDQTAMALGTGATTNNSTNSYAFGGSATVGFNKTNAIALGNSAAVNSDNSFAIGNSAVVNGSNSFAIGNSASANNANSLAIGPAAVTAFSITDAIAIGDNAAANSSNSIAIGSHSTLASKTQTNAVSAIAIGTTAVSNSINAIAIGTGANTGFNLTNPVAIGVAAAANGNNGLAIGNGAATSFAANSTALGAASSVSGSNSTAIGYNTSVTQNNAIILGDRSNTSLAVGIGTESFSGSNREKLLVDAGATSSVNAIVGRGTINSYLQLNILNQSNGAAASSDVVATADNGSETVNYIDMGINSSQYSATGILGGINNAYLYTTGNDFVIGNSTNNKSLIFYTTAASTNTERMRITSAGLIPGQDNAYALGNTTNRWTAVWSANGTIQTSDARLKKNIEPLTYGLSDVMKLEPVSYDWKDDSGSDKIGLIAQEVKKVIPQVVSGDETKENLGMNYAELVPVLINAIKELKNELDQTKKELAELKRQSGKK